MILTNGTGIGIAIPIVIALRSVAAGRFIETGSIEMGCTRVGEESSPSMDTAWRSICII
ncbi:hypothetical protein HYG81_21990 (plasmid) [Natrinema zhouii]|uniref:hypothetical protein n=1 Tax=Natrinema zhouii TaxID=1710539 RepID=UPI001CFFF6CE|nr:hypothetical protein [Natrinema zhouii]UHQ98646.1 hypothetical protein HYG81_21990 [Natrinema zhouii]